MEDAKTRSEPTSPSSGGLPVTGPQLFVDPEELSSSTFDWEYAVKEANEDQVRGLLGNQDDELKAKEEQLKKKLEAEFGEARKKMEEEKKVEIRKHKFDCVINCHRFASSGFLTGFSGAKHTAGYKQNPFSFLFNLNVKHSLNNGLHETERYNQLIEDFTDNKTFKPKLYPSSNDFEMVFAVNVAGLI